MLPSKNDVNASVAGLTLSRGVDEGAQRDPPHRDLNSLLVQEQTSIMSAESAETSAAYQFHRDASLHTRQLVNATSYPDHGPHVFAHDRATEAAGAEVTRSALIRNAEGNERSLAREFADGKVSLKSLQHRSRCLRQDREDL